MRLPPEDHDRLAFLVRLQNAPSIEITDWEEQFIENLITNPRPLEKAQAIAVDALRTKYEAAL